MKKLIFLATVTAAIFAGCSSDNPMLAVDDGNGNNGGGEPNGMVSPRVRATVDSPENPQSPMTGILEVYPCRPGTSIYFGNYIEGKLTPFPGMYTLKDGNTFGEPNRPLSLPVGTYNMVYWGTPKYEEPIYSNPVVMDSTAHHRRRFGTAVLLDASEHSGHYLLSGLRPGICREACQHR